MTGDTRHMATEVYFGRIDHILPFDILPFDGDKLPQGVKGRNEGEKTVSENRGIYFASGEKSFAWR